MSERTKLVETVSSNVPDRGSTPLASTILTTRKKNNMSNFTLKSITQERTIRPPRIILLGVEKIGKSSFAAGADNPIFIPIKLEEGIDDLNVPKFPVCDTLDKVMEAVRVLGDEDHDFKTLAIDSASTLEPIIWQAVCTEKGWASIEDPGFGRGYVEALNKWRELMEALDYLRDEKGMAIIIIGHIKTKTFNDPERASYDRYVFDVKENVEHALYRWSDLIGFANKNVGITEEKVGFNKKINKGADLDTETNYLFTKKTPAHPGGGRGVYGKLPAELPLYWKDFKEAVADVIASEEEKPKTTKKKQSPA